MDTNTPFRIAAPLASLRRIAIELVSRLVLACIAATLAACSMSPVEPPPVAGLPRVIGAAPKGPFYSRSIQLEPDIFAMQTGSRIFQRTGSPDIDLVGVVHVAEKDYYSRIQARLGKADVVLYEGVGGSADGGGRKDDGGNLTFERFALSLGLVVQPIDYSPKSFRWCDLTWQEMKGRLEDESKKGGPDAEAARKGLKEFDDLGKLLDGESWNVNMVLGLVRMSPYLKAYCRLLVVAT
ncbi:MAG TPA: hypothetical protein VGE67_10880, partial [Haloferula sp.]